MTNAAGGEEIRTREAAETVELRKSRSESAVSTSMYRKLGRSGVYLVKRNYMKISGLQTLTIELPCLLQEPYEVNGSTGD
ncbi:hypothetical protein CH289_04435 [Rhodococcus sp. RS1C4]|nr:hypothetical protein [Rhodococcus sp. RS1C4]OZC57140.1 hypothetical protein CH289_04435 [Rhodococcus sp. RS1C4]